MRNFVADSSRPVIKPRRKPAPETWDENGITAAWLGHSSVLVNFFGVTVLTDPVLLKRFGADLGFGTFGPKRLIAPALSPAQLPDIDVVLLSHAHMDHLDPATLRGLPGRPQAVAAHDTADLLQHTAIRKCHTLRWNERARVETHRGDLEVRAFEVKHWGARWRHDKYRGYNGYVLAREGRRIIFGGDTAWIASFRSLRNEGPFDAAIMPIGAYYPWISAHCTPEQAVQMADGAGAGYVLPVHFSTFPLGQEDRREPLRRLQKALEPDRLGWCEVGDTVQVS